MQGNVFPSQKVLRIRYVDDTELKKILDALSSIPGMIDVNSYNG